MDLLGKLKEWVLIQSKNPQYKKIATYNYNTHKNSC